jgi:hypothetical protein
MNDMTPRRGALQWTATADSACTCRFCIEAAACQYCQDWSREVTTRIVRVQSDEFHSRFDTELIITEYHSIDCPRLRFGDEGVRRLDLIPRPRRVGPPSWFELVTAEEATQLDTSDWPGSTWAYRAYDEFNGLLYIGITGNVAGRMRTHRRSSQWWPRCTWVELTVFSKREYALMHEKHSIKSEEPEFNLKHSENRYQ